MTGTPSSTKPSGAEAGWTVTDFRDYVERGEGSEIERVRAEKLGRLQAAISPHLKPRLRAAATRVIASRARGQVDRLMATGNPLRLHLGCGLQNKRGWVNIDLLGARADVNWDLSRGIPFPDATVDAVFHEHMYEHLTLQTGLSLAKESLRVMRPGGVIRIGVPDAGACLDSYSGHADPEWAHSRPTPMLAVQALFYEHGHLSMYDAETLSRLCEAAGFSEVARSTFGEGRLQPNPDTEDRRAGTLYIEAVKA